MPEPHEAAKRDQTWERAKAESQKFIADAAIALQAGRNPATVANEFAAMGVRTDRPYLASIMATLLVQLAQKELEAAGMLPQLPADPFLEQPQQTPRERAEEFLNVLTGISLGTGLVLHRQSGFLELAPLITEGDRCGQLDNSTDLIAGDVYWNADLARYTATAPDGSWEIP